MIDVRDIAACAARILTDTPSAHHGRTYTLTGPRSFSLDSVSDCLSRQLDRPVGYVPLSDEQQRNHLLEFGSDPWIVDMLGECAYAFITGWADYTTTAVTDITGTRSRGVASPRSAYPHRGREAGAMGCRPTCVGAPSLCGAPQLRPFR